MVRLEAACRDRLWELTLPMIGAGWMERKLLITKAVANGRNGSIGAVDHKSQPGSAVRNTAEIRLN